MLRLKTALLVAFMLVAASAQAEAPLDPRQLAETVVPHPLPSPVTTAQAITVAGRVLHFKATAGAIRLSNAQNGEPIADVGYVAFVLDGTESAKRPVAFALNGGPGAGSAWLDLGAMGPWRLPMRSTDIAPSAATEVIDNEETWLDFTDLVFIDPIGTGYSRILAKSDEAEKQFYSVNGDIASLSTIIRKWLIANNRLPSPKFIVGESYGGFRAPKIAKHLQSNDNIAVDGIIMVSPVLDFGWFMKDDNPAIVAGHLPSLVAAARGLGSPNPRTKLGAVESYAAGPYLVDLYKGLRDPDAIRRMSVTVAGFTGLDEAFVRRLGGRIDASLMMREKNRDRARIASAYDSNVTGLDPNPFDNISHFDDPVLDALKAPFATAMAEVTANRLKWPINATYEILNMKVNGHWDWNGGRNLPEAMSDLSSLLALDPHFRALVMHGVTDQVTPYFTSKMLIDQLPAYGDANRLALAVYGGGHMPYLEDEARAAMHEDARKLFVGEPAVGQR